MKRALLLLTCLTSASYASAAPKITVTGSAGVLGKTVLGAGSVLADHALGRASIERTDWKIAAWAHGLFRSAGSRLTVRGEMPQAGSYLFMSNHPSMYDIPALFAALPGPLRMVAKASLFNIPVFGQAMTHEGFIPVQFTRNRADAVRAMNQAGAVLKRGVSVWMAPEGGRSLPDGTLRPFKKGGFILARETGTQIVPIAIAGTEHIHRFGAAHIRSGASVELTIGKPISVVGRSVEDAMAAVRAAIQAELGRKDAPHLFTIE